MSHDNPHLRPKRALHGQEIFTSVVIALLTMISTGMYTFYLEFPWHKSPIIISQKQSQNIVSPTIDISDDQNTRVNPLFTHLKLEAKAVYIYDLNSKKVIFEKNAEQPLALASLTKVMTANTVLDLTSPSTKVTIEKSLSSSSDDIDKGLLVNEKWSVKNLLDYTLTMSSNEGAIELAAAAGSLQTGGDPSTGRKSFISEMNAKAQEIGLNHSIFYNESGLDQNQMQSGAYGSAHDVARLFSYTLLNHPNLLEATTYSAFRTSSLDNFSHIVLNTNSVIDKIPGLIASKTGFTDLAGGNLMVAYDAGVAHPIIIVVLGSSYQGRFTDMVALVNATNEFFSLQNNSPAV